MAGMTARTGYAPVNGLRMYFEVHGDGPPVVLIHGALGTIDVWGSLLGALARRRQVIAVELQGHGHTADVDRPLSYEGLADDVAAVLDHLGIAQADVIGHSMGGDAAIRMAARHPARVRRLVAISAKFRHDGEYPEVLAGLDALTPELLAGTPFEAWYMRSAPHPGAFPALVRAVRAFLARDFTWTAAELQAITAPTLVVIGDADTVRPEHAVELFRLLGGGTPADVAGGLPACRLAILPGTTHLTIIGERSDRLLPLIEEFLDAPLDGPDGSVPGDANGPALRGRSE